MPAEIKNRGIARQVLTYLKQYPNQNVDVEDVATALNVEVKTAAGAIGTLKANGYDITRPHHGIAVFKPNVPLVAAGTAATIQQRFENFMRSNPHVELTSDEISLKLGMNVQQISSGIYQMRKRGFTVNSPIQGVYVYVPTTEEVADLASVETSVPRPLLTDPLKLAAREEEMRSYLNDATPVQVSPPVVPTQAPPLRSLPFPPAAAAVPPLLETAKKMTSGHLYEEIGTAQNGDVLVRADDGVVYRLVQL